MKKTKTHYTQNIIIIVVLAVLMLASTIGTLIYQGIRSENNYREYSELADTRSEEEMVNTIESGYNSILRDLQFYFEEDEESREEFRESFRMNEDIVIDGLVNRTLLLNTEEENAIWDQAQNDCQVLFAKINTELENDPADYSTFLNAIYEQESAASASIFMLSDFYGQRVFSVESNLAEEPSVWGLPLPFVIAAISLIAIALVSYVIYVVVQQSNHDDLTGIWNAKRIMYQGGFMHSQGKLKDYAAVFVNLKDSKLMNQRFENHIGDGIIREYGQRMRKFLAGKGYVGRMGGDNYMIFIRKQYMEDFHQYIENVRMDVRTDEGMVNYHVKARYGIFLVEDGVVYRDIFNYASFALNEAKRRNVNYIYFEQELREDYVHNREVVNSCKSALIQEEFVPFYQPKIDIRTNRLCGCEALVRWVRGDEILLPAYFIPILEKANRVSELDFYVLENVCRDIREWLDLGMEPVRVSVNFSKTHLQSANFADRIIEIIDKYDIDGSHVEIELTESTVNEDKSALKHFVRRMRAEGILVAMDDFGTGTSSLAMLRDSGVDIIKLDKAFLDSASEGNAQSKVFIQDIIQMIEHQGQDILCEGVETQEQIDMLREFGCNYVQGFIYDKPMPKPEFEKRIRNPQYGI